MRKIATTGLAVVGGVLAMTCLAWAQDNRWVAPHGMFGPRVMGGPLQPKPMPFSDGLHTAPSGAFLGIATSPGLPLNPAEIPPPLPVDLDIAHALLARPSVEVIGPPPEIAIPVVPLPSFPEIPNALPAPASELPATQPAPQAPAVEPVPATPQDVPMRRTSGIGGPSAGAVVSAPPTATPSRGPQAVSALQTPGGAYTSFRPAFTPSASISDRAATRLTTQLSNSQQLRTVTPIQVSVQGETATLRGTVATPYDRAVAEQVVRMEAGIWHVDNQLQVSPSPSLSSTAPSPR